MPSLPSRRRSKRLYLRGLAGEVTEEDLFKCLSCYGKISEVKLLRSYSFVQFESEKDAELVLQIFSQQPLLGKNVVIEFAHPLRKDMPSLLSSNSSFQSLTSRSRVKVRHPVFVLGIPDGVRWQELKDFGRLSGRLVAYCDLDKTHRGRGFIEYFTQEDARCAARVLDGECLGGQRVHVVDHQFFHESRPQYKHHARRLERYSTSNCSRNGDHRLEDLEVSNVDGTYFPITRSVVRANRDYDDVDRRSSHSLRLQNSCDQYREHEKSVTKVFLNSQSFETIQKASTWDTVDQDHSGCLDDCQDRHYFYGKFYDEEPEYARYRRQLQVDPYH